MRRVDGVLAITMVLLALVSALGFAQETAAPMSTAAITGTWVNNEMMPPKVVIDSDGSFSYYFPASYSKPYQGWKTEVFREWTDSEGNVYYQTYDTLIFGGTMEHTKFQCLKRVTKSGTILEWNWTTVSAFSPEKFPPAIDPTKNIQDVAGYLTYHRAPE